MIATSRLWPAPHIYPTEENGVQLEWTIGAWEISATIAPSAHLATLSGVNVRTGESVDGEADLSSAEGWKLLMNFLDENGPRSVQ